MAWQRPLFFCIIVFLAISLRNSRCNGQLTSTEAIRPAPRPPPVRSNVTNYAWSSWGAWSPCSRSCGGGVSVQERHCLPRDSSRWRRSRRKRKLARSVEHHRRVRTASGDPDCPGLARRYHECNTEPCPGPLRDSRSEQCAVYDRRPFRGRFYTWVPYVDGNSPCTLNCRPRGQQFYASLALVVDGTPCTKPGFRAICVQGSCMVVGREGVLSSSAVREVRCGQRLVSGLFSRARLPLGYSYVTTVPRGACRLNVSEIVTSENYIEKRNRPPGLFSRARLPLGYSYVTTVPRGACRLNVSEIVTSENYIALRVTNGSYIMNGEFAVSAPGTYEAAGARFIYSRNAGLDSVFALGPIRHPVDIMVLYTQPNPSIKYEYLTDSEDDTSNDIPTVSQHHSIPRHHHRHHNTDHIRALEHPKPDFPKPDHSQVSNVIGNRKFTWKILSFTQCSRSCGGGLQVGKFKCVDVGGKEDKEVSPVNCEGSPPSSRRRRCGGVPCAPRWRAAAWGPCPVCGPAHRTRIVGCVQDHARGITKISDQKCPLPMPPSSEPCNVPNCDGSTATTTSPRLDTRRQVRPIDRTDNFRDSPVVISANTSYNEVSPVLSSYSHSAAGGWLYTEWSECVGWCVGGGVQTRGVRCADPSGCSSHRSPVASQACSARKQCDAQWFTGEWSPCSAKCSGRQVRGVVCIGGNGRRMKDGSCFQPRPEHERACGGDCAPSWYLSDWTECQGPCEAGIQTRTVWCAKGGAESAGGAARDSECPGLRPLAKKSCVPARCSSRPANKPVIINPPTVSDPQQRVTRHQSNNPHTPIVRERPASDGACVDKLSNCLLAVQARLCNYAYYADYCCRSCHGR